MRTQKVIKKPEILTKGDRVQITYVSTEDSYNPIRGKLIGQIFVVDNALRKDINETFYTGDFYSEEAIDKRPAGTVFSFLKVHLKILPPPPVVGLMLSRRTTLLDSINKVMNLNKVTPKEDDNEGWQKIFESGIDVVCKFKDSKDDTWHRIKRDLEWPTTVFDGKGSRVIIFMEADNG